LLSNDDTTLFIPFDPSLSLDYSPPPGSTTGTYVGKGFVGLLSVSADSGATLWYNIYVASNSGTVRPIDGAISIENSRYFYYISVNDYAHILVISTTDGAIRRQTRFGDVGVIPLGLGVSKLDRLAWNTVVSGSVLGNENPFATQTMIVSFWDTLLAETRCTDYAMILPSDDGSGNDVDRFLQVKMPVATNP
jgi:hypothetical protein